MDYTYCSIDTPDRPSLETLVNVCRAQVQAYVKHGGQFDADTQRQNIAGTRVILFTEGEFPVIVQNAAGFILQTHEEINALLLTPGWTDPNEEI